MRTRRGFTLIEMLVVIAIIAVLAAILFPVFGRARESARKTKCLANLTQVSTALGLYSADYGGFIVNWCVSHPAASSVPAVGEQTPDPSVATWDVSIGRYLKNKQVLQCPSNKGGLGRDARGYAVARYTQKIVGTVGSGWEVSWGRHQDDFRNPTETVMLFEKGNNAPGAWGDACGENIFESHNGPLIDEYNPSADFNQTSGGKSINVRPFHNNGKNLLFVDGHAKYFTATSGPFAIKGTLPSGSGSISGLVWTEINLPQ